MSSVADEIRCRKFPIAVRPPLLHAQQQVFASAFFVAASTLSKNPRKWRVITRETCEIFAAVMVLRCCGQRREVVYRR